MSEWMAGAFGFMVGAAATGILLLAVAYRLSKKGGE